jgi:hypothetical protein
MHVADVDERACRIVSTGPVRAIVELIYKGCRVAGKSIDLQDRITQWAGERGYLQALKSSNAGDLLFAAGLKQRQGIPESRPPYDDPAWLAMWGEQAVEGGNKAVSPLRGSNLGLAIVMVPASGAAANKDNKNYLCTFLKNGTTSWYSLAAWDPRLAGLSVDVPEVSAVARQLAVSVLVAQLLLLP